MKRPTFWGLICLVLSGLLFGYSCKKNPFATQDQLTGTVQKGPFVTGTSVVVQPLDKQLNPIGTSYQTQITDDRGNFRLNSKINAPYVELIAHGYYFNEVAGVLSQSELTLRSISKPSDRGNNINMLTTLAAPRIRKLVIEEHKDYTEAQATAQAEVLSAFGISLQKSVVSDRMDISLEGDENAALLAVSAIMQDSRSEAELSELIAAVSNDICQNGQLTNPVLKEKLLVSGIEIEPDKIRQNLIDRYAELGMSNATVPDFYDFVDGDGDGELNGANPYLILPEHRAMIDNRGGQVVIPIRSNREWEAVIPAEALSWLSLAKSSKVDNQLTLIVEPNQGVPRMAKIAVRHKHETTTQYLELSQGGTQVLMQVHLVDDSPMPNSALSPDQIANLVLIGFDKQGTLLFNHAIERLSETTLSAAVILPTEQNSDYVAINLYVVANDLDTYKDFKGTEEELKSLRSQQDLNRLKTPEPMVGILKYTLNYNRVNELQIPLQVAVAKFRVDITFDSEVFETDPELLEVTFTGINSQNGFLFPIAGQEDREGCDTVSFRNDYTIALTENHRYEALVYRMTSIRSVITRIRYNGTEKTYHSTLTPFLLIFRAGTESLLRIKINKFDD